MDQTQVGDHLGIQQLLDCLKESKLLSAEEMGRTMDAASQAGADVRSLSRELVAAGILTAYQLEAVCNRNYAELRIGNYDVLDRLGVGGMGAVFKARHRRMKRIVALKVLSRSLVKEETLVRRFQREVETIARLSHPNIVMAYDADEDESGPFLVMEFVNGHDLDSVVQKGGPLRVSEAVNYVLQAARGLEYAHGQGIIHRDIKPANLLRDAAGLIKVADLGLARFTSLGDAGGSAAGGITQAGRILGTVDYMPPEQAFDPTSIDQRADIYSLGATLHFLLLGQPPYQGQTIMATLLKHRDAPIPSLTQARAEVSPALDAIFHRMVAKAAGDRYDTMTEVVRALETIPTGPDDPGAVPLTQTSRPSDTCVAEPFPSPTRQAEWSLRGEQVPAGGTVDLKQPRTLPDHVRKVILVEPSRTQSAIIRRYLQAEGVQHVVAVASGQEALQAVRGERPDVVVSAMHLPDTTGVQLAQQVRGESRAAAPGFVLISSESEAAEAGTLSKCGQAILLQKPFTPEQLVQALRAVSASPPPSTTADRGKLRVLIVDDSTAARLHVRTVLQGLGLTQFVEAADGARAVAAVARERFDLIVTDYNMPFLDGRGLVGFLKQDPATASIPIILVTTEQDEAKLEEIRRLGVAAVCDKRFEPEGIHTIIDQLARTS
jgi:serine/threonine protein kinase